MIFILVADCFVISISSLIYDCFWLIACIFMQLHAIKVCNDVCLRSVNFRFGILVEKIEYVMFVFAAVGLWHILC